MASTDFSQRNLTPACSNCRARKVKCDRERPCSHCIKRGTQQACEYNVEPSKTIFRSVQAFDINGTTKLSTLVPDGYGPFKKRKKRSSTNKAPAEDGKYDDVLKSYDFTGVNPFESRDEVIDFYSTIVGVATEEKPLNVGPLSLQFITTKDLAINFFFEYEQEVIKQETNNEDDEECEETSGSKMKEKYQQTTDYDLQLKSMLSIEPEKQTFLDRVLENLPKKRIIKDLLSSFFENIKITSIDEDDFNESMTRIWGNLDIGAEDKITHLNINHLDDLACLGASLVLIRLGFLSLVSTSDSIVGKDALSSKNAPRSMVSNSLKDGFFNISSPGSAILNPASLTLIELAEECFKKFNLFIEPSFALLQFALLIRQYQCFAPEFSQNNETTGFQLFTGVLVQMAYSLVLNKDPDHSLVIQTPKQKNLKRKVWYIVMMMDLNDACSYGARLNCDSAYYDTKVPYAFDGDSQELFSSNIQGYLKHTRAVLRVILDISGKVKLSELTSKLNNLERFFKTAFGDLPKILYSKGVLDDDARKVAMKTYLSIVDFYISTYVHIYLHYENLKNSELSYFYLRKLVCLQVLRFMPYTFRLIFRTEDYFDKTASIVLIPNILETIKRSFFGAISLYIRLRFAQYTWKKNPDQQRANADISEAVDRILSGLNKILHLYLAITTRLSYRYYFAWELAKTLKRAINKIIKNDDFYKTYYPGAVTLRNIPYTAVQLNELNTIIHLGVEKFREIEQLFECPRSMPDHLCTEADTNSRVSTTASESSTGTSISFRANSDVAETSTPTITLTHSKIKDFLNDDDTGVQKPVKQPLSVNMIESQLRNSQSPTEHSIPSTTIPTSHSNANVAAQATQVNSQSYGLDMTDADVDELFDRLFQDNNGSESDIWNLYSNRTTNSAFDIFYK